MWSIADRLVDGGLRTLRNLASAPVPYSSRRGFSTLFAGDDATSVMERAYAAYGSVGTIFAIVTQLGNAFAKTEWHLYRKSTVRDLTRRKEVTDHALVTLWNNPNEHYTGRLFRETVQQHLDLVGEGVIVLVKIGDLVTEMWPVRPDRIHPIKHPKKFLTGYMYLGPDSEEVPLTLDQVIHIKCPNPFDMYRGMGPVQTVLADTDAARYSAEWNRNFFINGARPGGVIEVDYRMGDDEFKAFVRRWREQHQGVANAHRVAVLENAKWKDTQFSMADMQFVELRNLPREIIREAFAYPKPMLGTVDDVNRATAQAGKEIMAENQTIPRLERWADIINQKLLPMFANGKNLIFEPDDPTPVNHEDEDRARLSKTKGAKDLTDAGYHHDDVAEAMGLPKMRWSKPAALKAKPAPEPDDGGNESMQALVERMFTNAR